MPAGDELEAATSAYDGDRGNGMSIADRREQFRAELRAETLTAARDLIEKGGYGGLSMRKLAQRVGCSPMALYSYFPDKRALLMALAGESFERLAKRLDATRPKDPLAFLQVVLRQYVAYAEENPAEYQILFLTVEPAAPEKHTRSHLQDENPAFRVLFKAVSACIEKGLFGGDPFAVSIMLWTGVSGAATVLITQPNFPFESREHYVEEIIAILLAGVRQHSVRPI